MAPPHIKSYGNVLSVQSVMMPVALSYTHAWGPAPDFSHDAMKTFEVPGNAVI